MKTMYKDLTYPSCGKGQIHACRWEPEGSVKGIVQIIHGIAEYAGRYQDFAEYLNRQGYLVVAEDHMGHGKSGGPGCTQGYFDGGWFSAVADSYQLMLTTKAEFPDVPYILFGHSMGSFMTRTLLIKYPDCGISGAIICGTGWMPESVVKAGYAAAKTVCRLGGEKKTNALLHKLMFGAYNKRVEHRRTEFDWLNRDKAQVDRYIADPLCGFTETAGLERDMLEGILFIQDEENIRTMNRALPIHFIAGGDDPVGDYGAGVRKTVEEFQMAGIEKVSCRIYPLCRHEILNEINKNEIYEDIGQWIKSNLLD